MAVTGKNFPEIELFFEDFITGRRFDCGAAPVTEAAIIEFATEFDPQPIHLDPAAPATVVLGGLVASGWHTLSLGMRLLTLGFLGRSASFGSPGVSEARWLRLVRPGADLSLEVTVASARALKSRPHLGMVEFLFTFRQAPPGGASEVAATQKCAVMIGRREPGPEPAPEPEPKSQAPAAKTVAGGEKPDRPEDAAPPETALTPAEGLAWTTLEEIRFGEPVDCGRRRVDRAEIFAFARAFDPQRFHLDEAEGRRVFGGLSASGWHSAALCNSLLCDARADALAVLPEEAQARAAAAVGVGLGITDLRWARPVLEGDELRVVVTPRTLYELPKHPGWAALVTEVHGFNQRGEVAIRWLGGRMARLTL